MTRARRILLVTVGLSFGGAVLGALAAAVATTFVVVGINVMNHSDFAVTIAPLLVAAVDGAALGAILGPITAWLALRQVPLGRAFLTATIGTTVGALLGTLLPLGSTAGAVLGFVLASAWMRLRTEVSELAETPEIA